MIFSLQVLRCVIAAISVLSPACTTKSLNSPIIFNYSTYGEISSPVVVPLPVPNTPTKLGIGRRTEENPQLEIGQPTTTTTTAAPDAPNNNNNNNSKDEQQRTLSNSCCLAGASCTEPLSLAPPPDVIALVPPPPLPLFLFESEILQKREHGFSNWDLEAKKFNFRSYYVLQRQDNEGDSAIVFRINPQWLAANQIEECFLCDWAKNESSQSLFTAMKSTKGSLWINILIFIFKNLS